MNSGIHRINRYPLDKYQGNQYCAIPWIVIYPVESTIQLLNNQFLQSIFILILVVFFSTLLVLFSVTKN